MPESMDAIWQRALEGQPSVVIGVMPAEPEHEPPFLVVRIDCRAHPAPLGALTELRERLEQLSEVGAPLLDQASQRVWMGLRRRLLGEVPDRDVGAVIVEALNRLRSEDTRPLAVVFEAPELMDAESVSVLCQVLDRPGWLRTALVFHFRQRVAEGPSQKLVASVERAHGPGALVVGADLEPSARPEPVSVDLPADVRLVIRAAAVIGPSFETPLVAALIGKSELDVLYALQAAKDLGAPLSDEGGGRMLLAAGFAETERRELLPSLSNAWHKRLARLLADRARPRRVEAAPPSRERGDEPRSIPPPATLPPPSVSRPSAPPPSLAGGAPKRAQPGRAARHAEAAGDVDLAVEQYVAAAHRAAEGGAHQHAVDLAKKALELLGKASVSSKRRLLRVMALLALARVRWRAEIEHEPSGLADALELLGECSARLLPTDPVELRAEVAALSAAVHYDMGDRASLDKALAELGQASGALLEAGKPLDAARLLNDEAAVWVRAGDPVRAHHLLQKSREIFAARAKDDPVARFEMAETDHLLGRIVLHAPPRPGHGRDAIEVGIEHAARAEPVFRELDKPHELGRLWETLGRLEHAAGRTSEAVGRLVAAAELQQRSADVIGLARTSAALADIAREGGDPERAIALLEGSIDLNLEKGSPLGLAFNRRALETWNRQLTEAERQDLGAALSGAARRLAAAEATLGRVDLPEEALGLRHSQRPGP